VCNSKPDNFNWLDQCLPTIATGYLQYIFKWKWISYDQKKQFQGKNVIKIFARTPITRIFRHASQRAWLSERGMSIGDAGHHRFEGSQLPIRRGHTHSIKAGGEEREAVKSYRRSRIQLDGLCVSLQEK